MDKENFTVRVNDEWEFNNLSPDDIDAVPTGPSAFHILYNNRSYHGEVVVADYAKKEVTLRINGTLFHVTLSDAYDQLVRKLGLTVASAQVVKEVKAPMPGLVLKVNVTEGEEVEEGKALLILEAMKMENVIKSMGVGKVKAIHVDKGQPVEKNQILIEME